MREGFKTQHDIPIMNISFGPNYHGDLMMNVTLAFVTPDGNTVDRTSCAVLDKNILRKVLIGERLTPTDFESIPPSFSTNEIIELHKKLDNLTSRIKYLEDESTMIPLVASSASSDPQEW